MIVHLLCLKQKSSNVSKTFMNLFDNDLFDKEHNSFQWTFFVPSLNQGFSRLNMLLYDKNVIFFEFLRLLNISVEQEEGLSLHISLQNFYSRILQGSPNFYPYIWCWISNPMQYYISYFQVVSFIFLKKLGESYCITSLNTVRNTLFPEFKP